MNDLVSARKFGFPLKKIIPDELSDKCQKQEWCSIEIKSGLKEGQGVLRRNLLKKHPIM